MLFDSIQITEGGNISNLVVASGTTFPLASDQGELFFHTGDQLLYAYNGTTWVSFTSSVTAIPETQIADGTILARLGSNDTVSGNWTFTNNVTGVDPTTAQHLATKAYVDTIASGLKPKSSVKAATTGPITLADAQTIDGYAVVENDRVLVKNQLSWNQNGVWVVTATGAWTRAHDFDNSADSLVLSGDFFFVEHGSQGGTAWVLITQNPVVGTTGMEFSQVLSAANGVTWINGSGGTTGLTMSGGPITTAGTLTLGGTLAISNGGTGQTTANAALNALLPAQTSNGGKVLSTNGTTTSWVTQASGGNGATIGTTFIADGGTSLTLAGLTSVSATTFNGALNGQASSALIADTATTATTATNIAGGSGASIPYQTAAGTTAMLAFGTAGYVLTSNGSNAPSWQPAVAGTVNVSTNIAGGVAGSLPYQSGASATALLGIGSTSQVLTVVGGVPAWATAPTFTGGTVSSLTTNTINMGGVGSTPLYGVIQAAGGSGFGNNAAGITIKGGSNVNAIGGSVILQAGTGLGGSLDGAIVLRAAGGTDRLNISGTGSWTVGGTIGTAGYVLTSNGDAPPSWQASSGSGSITIGSTAISSGGTTATLAGLTSVTSTAFVGTATKATNIVGGVAGSLPYQSAADTTTLLVPGTNGYVLTLAAGVPTWAAAGGGGATLSGNNLWTAGNAGQVNAATFGATVTLALTASNNFSFTATSNFTLANPSGTITPGQSGIIAVTQDATGSRVISWGTYWKGAGGVKPTLSTAANAVDLISYYVVSATQIYVTAALALA